tara:strand:+ start:464 stop:673 length:210 start_codon:yes stop_codon:yes gene_type:complete
MIGYSPIDFGEPFELPSPRKLEVVADKTGKVRETAQPEDTIEENTECNYLVLFFIAGVVALAAMDSAKR